MYFAVVKLYLLEHSNLKINLKENLNETALTCHQTVYKDKDNN